MVKPLYCFIGKSASGKTSVANELEVYGFSQLWSYTTRPKRYEFETGHTFITEEEFGKLENIIAYTEYNGYKYCCTQEQIDKTDLYVIDVAGIETLLKNYKSERPIIVFYFDASVKNRIHRMINRGDSDNAIVSRLYNDEASDWEIELQNIIWNHNTSHTSTSCNNVTLYLIDANQDLNDVTNQIYTHIIAEMENKQ